LKDEFGIIKDLWDEFGIIKDLWDDAKLNKMEFVTP
jgi:hypothetical protein